MYGSGVRTSTLAVASYGAMAGILGSRDSMTRVQSQPFVEAEPCSTQNLSGVRQAHLSPWRGDAADGDLLEPSGP
jgi:hypothetical protein